MMPFRSSKILALFACIAVLLAAFLYGALWAIFIRERAALTTEASARSGLVARRTENSGLETLLAETAAKRAAVDALFVEAGGAPAFLEALERAGMEAGVRTTVVNVVQSGGDTGDVERRARAGIGEISVTLEGEGDFAAVLRFLALLEAFPRPATLARASFSQSEGGEWSGLFLFRALQHQNP